MQSLFITLKIATNVDDLDSARCSSVLERLEDGRQPNKSTGAPQLRLGWVLENARSTSCDFLQAIHSEFFRVEEPYFRKPRALPKKHEVGCDADLFLRYETW